MERHNEIEVDSKYIPSFPEGSVVTLKKRLLQLQRNNRVLPPRGAVSILTRIVLVSLSNVATKTFL